MLITRPEVERKEERARTFGRHGRGLLRCKKGGGESGGGRAVGRGKRREEEKRVFIVGGRLEWGQPRRKGCHPPKFARGPGCRIALCSATYRPFARLPRPHRTIPIIRPYPSSHSPIAAFLSYRRISLRSLRPDTSPALFGTTYSLPTLHTILLASFLAPCFLSSVSRSRLSLAPFLFRFLLATRPFFFACSSSQFPPDIPGYSDPPPSDIAT